MSASEFAVSTTLVGRASAALAGLGLDLVQPFRADLHGRARPDELGLPQAPRPDGLGLLIGASRALWPAFTVALRASPALADVAAPLESWIDGEVRGALASLGVPFSLRFAHDPPPHVAIQRLAVLVGLAPLGPAGLVSHPVNGPWISLRAVALFDAPGPQEAAAPQSAPCAGCAAPCATALDAALAGRPLPPTEIGVNWRRWLAVRDACPIGRAERYGEVQIRYHYDAAARATIARALATGRAPALDPED